jgi:hypothetical protein
MIDCRSVQPMFELTRADADAARNGPKAGSRDQPRSCSSIHAYPPSTANAAAMKNNKAVALA